ncbi:lipid-A-disaccharide synthase N-terminal domain-containing protein [Mesorhizobium sp. NPDC059054]|uniref:lipid-A-disaccharide synthase N-terminal domain-containing protein n=1 Tax=Mesorhizobium sp. NPDC059054 TaxID=3346711 RepID=UPI003691CABA
MDSVFQELLTWLHEVFVQQFDGWVLLGFVAQMFFTMRFVVQWVASERAKRSVVPIAFWFFSLGGGTLLLIYAIARRDPVFIAGQGLGLFIYIRNLWLIANERKAAMSKVD